MLMSDVRPWGNWEEYLAEPGYRVKRLTVLPGKRLSLQSHAKRSEVWVIVEGEGNFTIGDSTFVASIGQVLEVPKLTIHRIQNIGSTQLTIIETQLGTCLEEDIVRYEDDFGRV
jgi:mannose-6-phosphate isomerase-like protein (cupin superfamily)